MKVVVRRAVQGGLAWYALGFALLGCQSHQGASADAGSGGARDAASTSQGEGSGGTVASGSGGRTGPGAGGAGGTAGAGGAGTGGASPLVDADGKTPAASDAANRDSATLDVGSSIAPTDGRPDTISGGGDTADASTVTRCSPGITLAPTSTGNSEIWCNVYGWELGIPNGASTSATTFVLPSPMVSGADNAFSFVLTGAGPYNFEVWGTDTPCKAEELLWWGPFGAGTQCAQFKPSKPYANILFVHRQMYSASYVFVTPSWTLCPGGSCPGGTTGTGKQSDAPLTAPLGNYVLNGLDRVGGGWEVFLGHSGRMTVAAQGDIKQAGVAQPLSAGVFRMPSTDPYGDAWYCIGEGSTLTQIPEDIGIKGVQFSLRGITRLGECGDVPGTESLSAMITPSSTTGTYFAGDLTGTIPSWTGSNFAASVSCSGVECNLRFRGSPQQHFIHATTSTAPDGGDPKPITVVSATWLVQADSTKPFAMACSKSGSLTYSRDSTNKFELSKMSTPRACPGTPVANSSLDFTADLN